MEVVAQGGEGQSGEVDFLVRLDDEDRGPPLGIRRMGQVVNLERMTVTHPFNLDSILARGYWYEVTDEEGAALALGIAQGRGTLSDGRATRVATIE